MDTRLLLIVLAACFSATIAAVCAIGWYAIHPIEQRIVQLTADLKTNGQQINKVEVSAAGEREKIRISLNNRLDNFRGNMDARIREINTILCEAHVLKDCIQPEGRSK